MLVNLVTINLIAFALAYVLSRKLRGTNIFRTVIFMPNLLGGIVLGYIWQLIINGVLAFFKTTLTVKASYGFWGMVIAMNWQMIGYMMVIYIAAIQNISEDVKEAGSYRWSKPETDGYKDHPASDHACNYDLSVYDNDKCI